MDCPICLEAIAVEDEAYLDRCLHRFCLPCLMRWTRAQREVVAVCPLCKRPYSSLLHFNCASLSFQSFTIEGFWDDTASGAHQPGGSRGVVLTADERRRRALYFIPGDDEAAGGSSGRRGSRVRPPGDPEVLKWLTRELKVVLLEEDCSLVLQHLLALLRQGGPSAVRRAASRERGAAPSTQEHEEQSAFVARIAAGVGPYMQRAHAARFASELWMFLDSGLTVRARDAQQFLAPSEEAVAALGLLAEARDVTDVESRDSDSQGGDSDLSDDAHGVSDPWRSA